MKLVNGHGGVGAGVIEGWKQGAAEQFVVGDGNGLGQFGGGSVEAAGLAGGAPIVIVVVGTTTKARMMGPARKSKVVLCHGGIHGDDRP